MRQLFTLTTLIFIQSAFLTAAEPVATTGRWDGVVRDRKLQQTAPDNGVIADSQSWKSLWESWRPEEPAPEVDFGEEIVVVGVVSGPNRVLLLPTLAEDGDLRFVVGGTKMAGPGFGYALVKIDRKGVKTVNGKPIDNVITAEGKLTAGIFAIGGETTGTILETEQGTWELDFGDSDQLRSLAEKLNGKAVVVRGLPERREGVEIKERRIIRVESLKDATAALTGTVVVPATLNAFDGRTLELKLWQYDPFLADVSADLVDELIIDDYGHKAGTATQTKFGLGKPADVRDDRAYYLTVFVTQDGKRTHIGELDGRQGLCNVLNRGNPSAVKMIVREVGQ